LDNEQIDLGNIPGYKLAVFIEDTQLNYNQEFSWVPEQGKIVLDQNQINITTGQQLKVYVRHNAEYQYGDYNVDVFEADNSLLKLSSVYAEDTPIKIYTFDNFDHQGIVRSRVQVKPTSGLALDSKEYRTLANILNKKVQLTKQAFDTQYVWVAKNKQLLTPNVDYVLDSTKTFVNLLVDVNDNDEFYIIHFASGPVQDILSWQQFKDILNRTTFSVISNDQKYQLADNLHWHDKRIVLKSAENLPAPKFNGKPGVIWINGERIEYYVRDNNVLSQLRRGTRGTGTPKIHAKNLEVLYINDEHTIPYKDETITTMFTSDGTSNEYELDFIPNDATEFEVFVAGKRLRKSSIQKYKFETLDNDGNVIDAIAQDSPEGDETSPAEFAIVNDNVLQLQIAPQENVKILVVRKKGMTWYETGKSLTESSTPAAVFLQNAMK